MKKPPFLAEKMKFLTLWAPKRRDRDFPYYPSCPADQNPTKTCRSYQCRGAKPDPTGTPGRDKRLKQHVFK
jgi:hypothetical protein